EVQELEINPLVWTADGFTALDLLALRGSTEDGGQLWAGRSDLRPLFQPESIGILGVSAARRNPGRVILDQIRAAGFPSERLLVVHPGQTEIDGVRCVSDLAAMTGPVDLMVLAMHAVDAPSVFADLLRSQAARSVILVPGGLGERSGTEDRAARIQHLLLEARERGYLTPVVVGGNSLGIASGPGGYDATFVSRQHMHGLERGQEEEVPVALLSQSGALALTVQSRLRGMRPRYMVSIGNQLDLTHADYLEYLRADPELSLYACYVEGFAPGDGARWLQVAREITSTGRKVVLYRAGRSAAGASASSSHTASIAGDYALSVDLARQAGVVVAESLQEFSDVIRLLTRFRDLPRQGKRVGVLSNAGFECVAAADHLGDLELAAFSPETVHRLDALLADCGLAGIVAAQNPMDLTPTAQDAAFVEATSALLDDEQVDLAVLGCVPFTDALSTAAVEIGGDAELVARLATVIADKGKPCALVIDAGAAYEPLVSQIERLGIPTFRTIDRALRAFELFCASSQGHVEARAGVRSQEKRSPW
ncbi:MAG: CoA-binding protein, partial [Planctomycetota bacterium]